ncbi:hypothetical protein DICVIV_08318 [Dictyocaulus viviparus]|uniref:Uncharacterized protein n=1 Tax=Dictyocaulus viviparus TaxID=29172 RepID=A0A0D8XM67_DICVI|nr:hypothetical protein DICVIV_08318 [Dictyocaulus viviparus]
MHYSIILLESMLCFFSLHQYFMPYLKFDSAMVDTSRVHNVIDQLESAVINTIISTHVTQPTPIRSSALNKRPKQLFFFFCILNSVMRYCCCRAV